MPNYKIENPKRWNNEEQKLSLVLQNVLRTFCRMNELNESLSDSFEAFVNHVVRAQYTADAIEVSELYGFGAENGIDGAFFFAGDREMSTVEEASAILASGKSKHKVTVVFTQAKTETFWKKGGINTFESAIRDWVSGSPKYTWSDYHHERQAILDEILNNTNRIENGKPDLKVYFCNASATKKTPDIEAAVENAGNVAGELSSFRTCDAVGWSEDELVAEWSGLTDPVKVQADIIDSASFDEMPEVESSHVVIINAKKYVDHILTDEQGNIRKSVFDENVRDYLGEEEEVNDEIANTIKDQDKSVYFGVLNNGITIISPNATVMSRKLTMEGFQIVNGCQTSNVLFDNRDSLDDSACVVLKVIVTDDAGVSDSIVRSTNRQSQVDPTQFMAMSAMSKKIEKYFDARGTVDDKPLYYERRTNQFAGDSSITSNRSFDMRSLARCTASMFFELPHVAKRYPQNLFKTPAGNVDDKFPTSSSRTVADAVFDQDNQVEIYYCSAYAYWKLWSLLSNIDELKKYKIAIYHIMMGIRIYLSTKEIDVKSPKAKGECKAIEEFCAGQSKEDYSQLLSICECMGPMESVNRDTLKAKRFSIEYRENVIASRG